MADRITDGREGLNPLFNRPRGRAEKVSFDLLKSQRRPAFLDREQPAARAPEERPPLIRPRVAAARVSKVQRHGSSVLYHGSSVLYEA